MIVLKIGGSSVEDAAAVRRVIEIVGARRPRRPVVVVSAMARTTRRLLESAEAAAAGNPEAARAGFDELRAFHLREATALLGDGAAVESRLDPYFRELSQLLDTLTATRELTPRRADAVAAFGELLSSEILALALGRGGVPAAWIDCRRVLVTDGAFTSARPLYDETDPRLRAAIVPLVERGIVPVLGGYVGATAEGITTTLGKEGSDFSAAIVGAALGASEVEIWTDVDGILTADPRLVPGALRVRSLSFAESLELACSGAKKPHPGTLGPAGRADVPIRVLNSRTAHVAEEGSDGAPGTLIGRRRQAHPAVKSIACRVNDHLLYVRPGARTGGDFLSGVLAVAERLLPALLPIATSETSVTLALDRADRLPEVRAELHRELGGEVEVGVVHGRAVVSLVSQDLATDAALVARALSALDSPLVSEPALVARGIAAPAVRGLVEAEDLPAAIALIHGRLFPGGGGEAIE